MKQAGRKTGNLSNGKKEPPSKYHGGLDWDAQRQRYRDRMASEWERGTRNVDTIRARWLSTLTPKELAEEEARVVAGQITQLELDEDGEPQPTGERGVPKPQKIQVRKTGFKGRVRTYDVDEIVRLYTEENMMPKDIALRPNMPSSATIIGRLKDRGVFDRKKFRQGWIGSPDGKNPIRPKESYERKKYCGVCGTNLDLAGNSAPRWKKGPGGVMKPDGRDCIPCRRRRAQEARDGK